MSKETGKWLNTNTLIGFAAKRGNAWHYRLEDQDAESNHYDGAIPLADVRRRLFHWQAQSAPVQAQIFAPNGDPITITDDTRQAIIRPDTRDILGVFKSGYQIHQYDEWLLNNVASLLDDDLAIGSAGLLEGGGIAWVQVEMPENVETPEGETIRPFLLATTSLNGKLATSYALRYTRVVCDNTLECANGESGQAYKRKHSKYSDIKIGEARDALGIIFKGADDIMSEIAALNQREVTGKQFISWLDAMVPMPEKDGRTKTMAERKREEMLTLWMTDPRVAPWQGTAWGVLQTANTWQSHFAAVHKGTDRGQRNIFQSATGKSGEADRKALATLDAIMAGADASELVGAAL